MSQAVRRLVPLLIAILPLVLPMSARAQMASREGIALQNQILELRRELDMMRRGGTSLGAPPVAPSPRGAGSSGEIVGQLLQRVGELEEEVRRLRGRAEEAEFRNQQLAQEVEKLRGDLDFRLQQLEGTGGGTRPAAPAQRGEAAPQARPAVAASSSRPAPMPAPAPKPTPAAAAAPRTPERALSDGRAALKRRDYPAAEAAAREVLAARGSPRAQDAGLLLGDALIARREYQNAALAYDDAYRRNRRSGRASEALLGLASAFSGFGGRREACETLDQLRSEFPRLSAELSQRATELRRRNNCR